MAIAAVGEGTSKVMQNELGKVVEYVLSSMFLSFFVDGWLGCWVLLEEMWERRVDELDES